MRQFQFLGTRDGDGSAKHATPFAQHEVHLLGGNHLCRGDEVTLVLSVFIIDYDDELSLSEVLYRLFYFAKLKGCIHVSCLLVF